jgi:hypothetical protein
MLGLDPAYKSLTKIDVNEEIEVFVRPEIKRWIEANLCVVKLFDKVCRYSQDLRKTQGRGKIKGVWIY